MIYSKTNLSKNQALQLLDTKWQFAKHYQKNWLTKDGGILTIRPAKLTDLAALARFYRALSPQTVLMRWFTPLTFDRIIECEQKTLLRALNAENTVMLVAECCPTNGGRPEIMGVATLALLPERRCADLAVLVADNFQHRGLGTELMQRLISVGRHKKLNCIIGDIHPENQAMRHLCQKLGFRVYYSVEEQVTKFEFSLSDS